MKFIGLLERKYYSPVQSSREGVWLWEDKATPLVRLRSPVPSPWGKEWVILPTIEKSKTDKREYPNRLIFKLFPLGQDLEKITLVRQIHQGNFVHFYTDQIPGLVGMYIFPHKDHQKTWLVYYLQVR
ncbi:hypothetical protein [Anabaena azotica]|uniref:Uncharacterized protein n=1 Tax=Anabaena azotica FACHB-119 TaxID=947527 RepID=A0ABR8DBK8_9NOST|nr:hypothetical protein [Anabaena azotica]MBD2503951.1 hypothetical protein [Anabaena azotica FACHB-119]